LHVAADVEIGSGGQLSVAGAGEGDIRTAHTTMLAKRSANLTIIPPSGEQDQPLFEWVAFVQSWRLVMFSRLIVFDGWAALVPLRKPCPTIDSTLSFGAKSRGKISPATLVVKRGQKMVRYAGWD
jgi:hypothetical protein